MNPTETYSQYVTGKLATYMLVNTANDRQNIRNNLGGSYALGRNIDASEIANFMPIGTLNNAFAGMLDGQGQISNLTIAPNNAPPKISACSASSAPAASCATSTWRMST